MYQLASIKTKTINIAEYFFKFLIILKQFIKESNLKWLLELVKSKHIFIKKIYNPKNKKRNLHCTFCLNFSVYSS